MKAGALSDTVLLAIELDTLWNRDERGRLLRGPHFVIAASSEDQMSAVGSDVPEELAAALLSLAGGGAPPPLPGEPPAGLDAWAARLASAMGPVEVTSGPSYVAEVVSAATSPATLIRSDGNAPYEEPLEPPEEARWQPEEWRMLLAGELGPWAVATVDDAVVAICFCARLTEAAAEAGLWTHPNHRRQGHATAVTASWAGLVIGTGRHAFYSTSASNLASQGVAARLGLRPIGWIWQVGRPRP